MKKTFISISIILLVFLILSTSSVFADQEITKPYVEGEVIIKYKNSANNSIIQSIENNHNLSTNKSVDLLNVSLVKSNSQQTTQELINELKNDENIDYVQPNFIYTIKAQTTPWGITTNGVQADTAITNNNVTGNGIVVAVIDTGVDLDHEDLDNNLWNAPGGMCLVSGVSTACPNHGWDFVSTGDNDPTDNQSHGTHVAGTIAAEDNNIGVIGVAPEAQIMAVKVLSATGSGTTIDIAEGIVFATENNADIINMSIGGFGYDAIENEAVSNAWDAGIVVVSAAGNETQNLLSYPGGFEKSIAVGAIQETTALSNPTEDMNTRLADFSNYGFTDVVAPGARIMSTYYDGTYSGATWNGTSMASPHVAGVAALILEKYPSLTPSQVKQQLEKTATDIGKSGRDQYFGSGLVNANLATNSLSAGIVLSANFTEDDDAYMNEPTSYYPAIPADGESTTKIKAYISNSSGEFVSGQSISFTTDLGTLSSESVITDINGMAEITITASSVAGTATITANAGNYGTATVEIDMANILLVSDSVEWYLANNLAWYYERMLQDANQKFIRHETFWGQTDNYPTADYLQKFDLVIWYTGDYTYILDDAQNNIASYLDSGGNLLISGPDQLMWIEDYGYANDIIYEDYLKAVYGGDYCLNYTTVTGAGLFDGSVHYLIEPYGTYYYGIAPDYITVLDGGVSTGTYGCGQISGVSVDSTYKSIYMPYGIESIYYKAERDELISTLLSFFLPVTGVTSSNISGTSATISWDTYVYGTPDSYTLSYGTDENASNISTETTSDTTLILDNLNSDTTYFVKIAANLTSETTDYSKIHSFTTDDGIPDDSYNYDPSDTTLHDTVISSIEGQSQGKIKINYKTGDSALITIFNNNTTSKETKIKQYRNTGYYIIQQALGKKIALINSYKGEVLKTETLSSKKWKNNGLKIMKLRNKYWAVSTLKNKDNKYRLVLNKILINQEKFGKTISDSGKSKKIKVLKTKRHKTDYIKLRSKNGGAVKKYIVSKKFKLNLK